MTENQDFITAVHDSSAAAAAAVRSCLLCAYELLYYCCFSSYPLVEHDGGGWYSNYTAVQKQ